MPERTYTEEDYNSEYDIATDPRPLPKYDEAPTKGLDDRFYAGPNTQRPSVLPAGFSEEGRGAAEEAGEMTDIYYSFPKEDGSFSGLTRFRMPGHIPEHATADEGWVASDPDYWRRLYTGEMDPLEEITAAQAAVLAAGFGLDL